MKWIISFSFLTIVSIISNAEPIKKPIYTLSIAPIVGIDFSPIKLSTKDNFQKLSELHFMGYTRGTTGVWAHVSMLKQGKNYNRISLGFFETKNLRYDIETPSNRINYWSPSYDFTMDYYSFLIPLKYSRGLKHVQFMKLNDGKKIMGYPELSIGVGLMNTPLNNRPDYINHSNYASDNIITRLNWSQFLHLSGGIQFMRNEKERFSIYLVWTKGLRKVIESELSYTEVSGYVRTATVYTRGTTLALLISYPIFQRVLSKSTVL